MAVTPDQLHALSASFVVETDEEGLARQRIRAAADEIDHLRGELRASVNMHEQARQLADAAITERDRLRKLIEDAPHDTECEITNIPEGHARNCTCWKADAL
jgi:hypothetical protein